MPSRQTLHNRDKSVEALRALIPSNVPLSVHYVETTFRHMAHFCVQTLDGRVSFHGRYQAVYAWLEGFLVGRCFSTAPPSVEDELAKLKAVMKAVKHHINQ